jgi:glycine/D-amino acid oxidase-like deaminating enzyme
MVKASINIIPLKADQYWVGSNYEWDPKDDKPSEAIKENLISKLNRSVTFEYDVIDHKSAIRACTKDRKPYLGVHPDHSQLVIFNGLGTKGMSLAPYFAEHLFDHLEYNVPLMPEVDIKRVF